MLYTGTCLQFGFLLFCSLYVKDSDDYVPLKTSTVNLKSRLKCIVEKIVQRKLPGKITAKYPCHEKENLKKDYVTPQRKLSISTDPVTPQKKISISTDPVTPQKKISISTDPVTPQRKMSISTDPVTPQKKMSISTDPVTPQRKMSISTDHVSPQRKISISTDHVSPQRKISISTDHVSPQRKISISTDHVTPQRKMSISTDHVTPQRKMSISTDPVTSSSPIKKRAHVSIQRENTSTFKTFSKSPKKNSLIQNAPQPNPSRLHRKPQEKIELSQKNASPSTINGKPKIQNNEKQQTPPQNESKQKVRTPSHSPKYRQNTSRQQQPAHKNQHIAQKQPAHEKLHSSQKKQSAHKNQHSSKKQKPGHKNLHSSQKQKLTQRGGKVRRPMSTPSRRHSKDFRSRDQEYVKSIYQVTTKTGSEDYSSTDCHVYLHIYGLKITDPQVLYLDNPGVDEMQDGAIDTFKFEYKHNLGRIKKFVLEVKKFGFAPGWLLKEISLKRQDVFKGFSILEKYQAEVDKWFQSSKGLGVFNIQPQTYQLPMKRHDRRILDKQ